MGQKIDVLKLAISGWGLADIKELLELDKNVNQQTAQQTEPQTAQQTEIEKLKKQIAELQNANTRKNIVTDKKDTLEDLFRSFM